MKARKYWLILMIFAILSISAPALAIPQSSPKTNFGPRKKKLTVARLKEAYGKPFFHLKYDKETSATIVTESPRTVGKIWHDEVIAFKIDDYLVTYYFSKGKFLARVLRGGPSKAEMPELLP